MEDTRYTGISSSVQRFKHVQTLFRHVQTQFTREKRQRAPALYKLPQPERPAEPVLQNTPLHTTAMFDRLHFNKEEDRFPVYRTHFHGRESKNWPAALSTKITHYAGNTSNLPPEKYRTKTIVYPTAFAWVAAKTVYVYIASEGIPVCHNALKRLEAEKQDLVTHLDGLRHQLEDVKKNHKKQRGETTTTELHTLETQQVAQSQQSQSKLGQQMEVLISPNSGNKSLCFALTEKQCTELVSENQRLRNALVEEERKATELQGTLSSSLIHIETVTYETQQLSAAYQDAEKRAENAKTECTVTFQRQKVLEEQLANAQRDMQHMAIQLENQQATPTDNATLPECATIVSPKKTDHQKSSQNQHHDTTKFIRALESAKEEIERLRQALGQQEHKVKSAEEESERLRQALGQQGHKAGFAEEEIERLRQAVGQQEHEAKSAEEETERLRQALGQQEHKVKSAEEETERLRQALGQQRHKAGFAEEEIERLRQALGQQEHEVKSAEEEIQRLRQALEQQEHKVKSAEEETERLRQALGQQEHEVLTLTFELRDALKAKTALEHRYTALCDVLHQSSDVSLTNKTALTSSDAVKPQSPSTQRQFSPSSSPFLEEHPDDARQNSSWVQHGTSKVAKEFTELDSHSRPTHNSETTNQNDPSRIASTNAFDESQTSTFTLSQSPTRLTHSIEAPRQSQQSPFKSMFPIKTAALQREFARKPTGIARHVIASDALTPLLTKTSAASTVGLAGASQAGENKSKFAGFSGTRALQRKATGFVPPSIKTKLVLPNKLHADHLLFEKNKDAFPSTMSDYSRDVLLEKSVSHGFQHPGTPKTINKELFRKIPEKGFTKKEMMKKKIAMKVYTKEEMMKKKTAMKVFTKDEMMKKKTAMKVFTKEEMMKKKLLLKKPPGLETKQLPAEAALEKIPSAPQNRDVQQAKPLPPLIRDLFTIYEDLEMRYLATDTQTRAKLFANLVHQLQSAQASMEQLLHSGERLSRATKRITTLTRECQQLRAQVRQARMRCDTLHMSNVQLYDENHALKTIIVNVHQNLAVILPTSPSTLEPVLRRLWVITSMQQKPLDPKTTPTREKYHQQWIYHRASSHTPPPRIAAALAVVTGRPEVYSRSHSEIVDCRTPSPIPTPSAERQAASMSFVTALRSSQLRTGTSSSAVENVSPSELALARHQRRALTAAELHSLRKESLHQTFYTLTSVALPRRRSDLSIRRKSVATSVSTDSEL